MIEQYYNRFNPSDNYEHVMFRADRVLQSAELNEIQSGVNARLQRIGDALFKDGDIVRDAGLRIDAGTGMCICEAGAVYLRGSVRGVAPATLTVAAIGLVTVGLYLKESVVTELEAPELRNPAVGTRGSQEPGAARMRLLPVWGVSTDGQSGEFYPVYQIEDGVLRSKEAPPNLDGVTQALARYDRDSSGGSYVVSGLNVAKAADVEGQQVYTVSEGRARVNGFGVTLATGRRQVYPATPELRSVFAEPHRSATAAVQRIDVDKVPLGQVSSVTITKQKVALVSHAIFAGGTDALPDSSVTEIVAVNQNGVLNAEGNGYNGGFNYVEGTHFRLVHGKIDWSLPGDEPGVGNSYNVIYRYNVAATPTAIDDTGFSVAGAVPGSDILVNYTQKLPRIDRLCLNAEGALVWIKGVASETNPHAPNVPDSLLCLASVHQTWQDNRLVVNDGVRVVPMQELANINARMDFLASLIAQQTLRSDAANRDTSLKKGIFVDPFLNDDVRDQGAAQTAAIVGGKLTLPVTAVAAPVGDDVTTPTALSYTLATVLSQPMRTTSMEVNPYMAFEPIPATVKLVPAVDRWTEVVTNWSSPLTERIVQGSGPLRDVTTTSENQLLSSSRRPIEKLRQIPVQFSLNGFGPNEALDRVTFDGIAVIPTT